jgi:hypothetical protein
LSISALQIKNKSGDLETCEQFPHKVPAVEVEDKEKILREHVCSMNAVSAMYNNLATDDVISHTPHLNESEIIMLLLTFQSDSSLKLFEQLLELAYQPAIDLLHCLLEGRGVSLQAELLRYECAKHHS